MTKNTCSKKKVQLDNDARIKQRAIKVILSSLALGLLALILAVSTAKSQTITGLSEDLRVDLCQENGLDKVPLIISPSRDIKEESWTLEELWTLGGPQDQDVPLGYITGVVYQDSLLYVLDTKSSLVYVMTLEGQCIDLIDVSGEGPGQCSKPNSILGIGDGHLVLVKGQPARLIYTDFDRSLPQSRELVIPEADMYSYVIVNSIWARAGIFLAYGETTIITDRKKPDFMTIRSLSSYGQDGREVQRYFFQEVGTLRQSMPTEADIPHYAYRQSFTLAKDGRVYVAPYRDKYLIYVFAPSGQLEQVIGRDFRSRERTKAEIILASFMGEHGGQRLEMEVEDNEADILSLDILGSELLVRSSYSEYQQQAGVYTQLELFQGGRFTKRINLLGTGSAYRDELYWLSSDLLAVVRGNKDAVQYGIETQLKDYQAQVVSVSLYRVHRQ